MDWNYVSGFFDADGSISLIKKYGNEKANKTIQISFHNTELTILEEIRDFILRDVGIRGSISTKRPQKETHSISYELKYTQYKGYLVSRKINSHHPKKKHRIETYVKIQKLTPRNGKYFTGVLKKRNELIETFFIFADN